MFDNAFGRMKNTAIKLNICEYADQINDTNIFTVEEAGFRIRIRIRIRMDPH
jgi:hypothetical protein